VVAVERFDVIQSHGLCSLENIFSYVVIDAEAFGFFVAEEHFGSGQPLRRDFLQDAVFCREKEFGRFRQSLHQFADAFKGFWQFVGLGSDVAENITVFVFLFRCAVD